jgi:hypothetical protein
MAFGPFAPSKDRRPCKTTTPRNSPEGTPASAPPPARECQATISNAVPTCFAWAWRSRARGGAQRVHRDLDPTLTPTDPDPDPDPDPDLDLDLDLDLDPDLDPIA